MKGPHTIETARLVIRKPQISDAEAIFERYSGDPDVGEFLAWPIQESADETRAFLERSEREWAQWPAGAFLITRAVDGSIIGGTGLHFETPQRASTGYVIAKDCWGKGYASEALGAMQELAARLSVKRLYAVCHTEHTPSRRVLEKAGFQFEGVLRRYCEFPNHKPGKAQDVFSFSWIST